MVNSVGKKCSEVDLAYIAGLIDADGAIMAPIEKHLEKKFKFRIRVIVKLTQKKRDLLEWVKLKLGVGGISKNRRTYDLRIRDQQDVKQVLLILKPFIKGKEKQLNIALKILDIKIDSKSKLIKVARLADTLSGYNVRSSGRRVNYTSKIQEYFSSND